jgi:hypothetical protein
MRSTVARQGRRRPKLLQVFLQLARDARITVTVYLSSRSSGNCRLVSPSIRENYGDSLPEFSQKRQSPLGVPVHSGLWARFAGRQAPAELPLERRDPFRRAKRPSDRGCPLDPSRRRGIGRCREKRRKIGDQRA